MAAQRAMSRLGPGELTLADIAGGGRRHRRAAGAAVRLEARSAAGAVGAVFRRHRRDVRASCGAATARRWRRCAPTATAWRTWPSSPAAFARNFAYLQIDLTDPDFRKHLAKHAAATRVELQKLIKEAIDAKELVAGHQCQAAGAHDRGGGRRLDDELGLLSGRHCRKWMRHDLDAVLKPYLT